MSLSATQRTATLAESIRAGEISSSVLAHARERVIDLVGVAISGSVQPRVRRMQDALAATTSRNEMSVVWGTPRTTPPATAALLNAAAAHSEDFDDTHMEAVVHGSACIIPAAWAAAEIADSDANTLLRGVVSGWEIAARIGLVAGGSMHARGWHTSSIAGVFGAAAAASSVFELSCEAFVSALGLAGSAAGGINAYLQNGSDGKLLNVGWAAANGLQAAEMARAGVVGPPAVLEGRYGILEACTGTRPDVEPNFSDIGNRWHIEAVSTKPYPVCHFAHASIDAAIELTRRGVAPNAIDGITAYLPPLPVQVLCEPREAKLEPPNEYAVRFSLPWLLALAFLDGNIGRANLAPGCLARADARALATRVEVRTWDDSPYPETFPGRLCVRLEDGSTQEAEVLVNSGHPLAPLPSIDAKFVDCLRAVPGIADRAGEFLHVLKAMDGDTRIRDVDKLMRA